MQLIMSNVELASDSIVDRVYEQLKAMAVSYEFKPGERLNEGELAKRLGVSRTPLREALNRLNTEGFLRFTPGKGFFCRELDAHEIFDLYETFHERLMGMSNNAEMLRVLRNVNARIRFVRWIDMDRINRSNTQAEHRAVVEGLKARDEEACVSVLE